MCYLSYFNTLFFFGVVVISVNNNIINDSEHELKGIHDFQASSFLFSN